MSGPAMNAMPNTAPNRPWYLPRSAGREQVADDRERDREQRAGADALDAPEQDQLLHVLRQAGQGRADQEDDDADDEHRLAAVEVGQLAPERDADRAGQQVDRDDPDVEVVAVELGDDRGQRRTDDRLVEGAQEQPEHDREEDLQLLPGSAARARDRRRGSARSRSARRGRIPSDARPFLRVSRCVGCGRGRRGSRARTRRRPRRGCRRGPRPRDRAGPASSWPRIACSRSCFSASVSSRVRMPFGPIRTRTTRRSSGTRTRSTSPRSSIRSMIPVALLNETSRSSASRLIGRSPWCCEQPQDVHVGHADAGLDQPARAGAAESRDHVVEAARRSASSASSVGARRDVGTGRASIVRMTVNNLASVNDRVKRDHCQR